MGGVGALVVGVQASAPAECAVVMLAVPVSRCSRLSSAADDL